MRGLHDREPLIGNDLVGADDGPHLVVEDLCGGAGQRTQSGLLQLLEEVGHGSAERRRPLPDLQRREGMDVDRGLCLLDSAADREIGLAGVVGMDAALEADLGCAAIPGLAYPPHDLLQWQVVGPAAQILAHLALGEGAELAAEVADVGVVDVAVHHIANLWPANPCPEPVGSRAHRIEGAAARLEEPHQLVFVEARASLGAGQKALDVGRHDGRRRCAILRRWLDRAREPGDRCGDSRSESTIFSTRVAQCRRIEPALARKRIGGIDREPLGSAFSRQRRSHGPARRDAATAPRD